MIVPVLKDIEFIDNPLYQDEYGYKATAYISEENDLGADCFHFRVLTLKNLTEILKNNEVFNGRATLIVNELDWGVVEQEIKKILDDCKRSTWDEVAKAINRHLNWEYDNIRYETIGEAMTRLNKDE